MLELSDGFSYELLNLSFLGFGDISDKVRVDVSTTPGNEILSRDLMDDGKLTGRQLKLECESVLTSRDPESEDDGQECMRFKFSIIMDVSIEQVIDQEFVDSLEPPFTENSNKVSQAISADLLAHSSLSDLQVRKAV